MLTADIIVDGGTVLTMNGSMERIADGCVAIVEERIVAVGKAAEIRQRYRARKIVSAQGGIIMPGLVNAHCHVAMTCFRGVADDMELLEWLNKHMFPLEARFVDPKMVYAGSLLGIVEMVMGGTTTFCDMYFFEDETARAAAAVGMRCLLGEVLLDFPSPNTKTPAAGLAYSRMLLEKWRQHPLVRICVEPHALYTCSRELLMAAKELAEEFSVPLGMHLLENAGEKSLLREKLPLRATDFLAQLGLLDGRFFAFHGVELDEYDMELFASSGAKVVHNPESNLKLASGMAPVAALVKRGVGVGLGTDGAASNNNLDMFGEMATAARLAKVREMRADVLPAVEVVKMATIGGARVLSWEDEIGSLEVGKRADVITIATNKPHLTPMYDEYSHLVYAVGASDVDTVIIGGRVVMESRKVLTVDVEDVLARVVTVAKKIKEFRLL